MKKVTAINTIDLFPVIDQKLIEVLRSLQPEEWEKKTVVPLWNIHDIALHLLDGNLRGVSTGRDRHFSVSFEGVADYKSIVAALNQLNHSWIESTKRISPPLLVDLLEISNQWYLDYLKTLNPDQDAIFSVAWAGEQTSPNWFHVAREYTEKFHHQQQIRLALGRDEELLQYALYHPFLDTLIRALPHHYSDVQAKEGTVIRISISEDLGEWFLVRSANSWGLYKNCDYPGSCSVIINKKIAWRLFTKGISKSEALKKVEIQGDQGLGEKMLGVVAIMG